MSFPSRGTRQIFTGRGSSTPFGCCPTSEYTDQYITPRRITAPMDLPFWSTSCQSTFVRLRFNIPGQYITNIPARHSRQEHENTKGVRQTLTALSLVGVCSLCAEGDRITTSLWEQPCRL